MKHVIIGEGPEALRAAARLGEAVWLSSGSDSEETAEIPEDRGFVSAADGAGNRVSALYGAAPAALSPSRGILLGGRVHALPLRRRDLARLLPPEAAQRVFADWVRARTRIHLRRLVGGGLEERTYRDWVVHRVGEGAFEQLYRRYGEARFGPTDKVNAAAARLVHALPDPGPHVGLGDAPASGVATLRRKVRDRRPGVKVLGVELREGRVRVVRTTAGDVPVEGQLWWVGALPDLVPLIGDLLSETTRWEMLGLPCRHRVQVMLRREGGGAELPGELHVLEEAPFFRVSRPEIVPGAEALDGWLVAHLSLAADAPEAALDDAALAERVAGAFAGLGLPAVQAGGARVLRLPSYDPCWHGVWHTWHVRVCEALGKLGIRLAGRAATYRPMDAGRSLLLMDALLAKPEEAHESYRVLADPPVTLDDEQASFANFVER